MKFDSKLLERIDSFEVQAAELVAEFAVNGCDARWLNIARTHIEQAAMAMRRAGYDDNKSAFDRGHKP